LKAILLSLQPGLTSSPLNPSYHPLQYDTVTLEESLNPYYNDSKPPYRGCLPKITLDPFAFAAYVKEDAWKPPLPMLTHFTPGHDARILAPAGSANATTVDIRLEYNTPMDCDALQRAISFEVSKHASSTPSLTNANCQNFDGSRDGIRNGVDASAWYLEATLTNVPDGVTEMIISSAPAQNATWGATGVTDRLLMRKGAANNVLVFPDQDYDSSIFTKTDTGFLVSHTAVGADRIRYSWNYGKNYTDWYSWEATTTIERAQFPDQSWPGQHIILEYYSELATAAPSRVHADIGYDQQRRLPAFLARGPFNNWGYDSGLTNSFAQDAKTPHEWSLQISSSWPTVIQLCVFGYDDYFYGDVDNDGVMDRLPPTSTAPNYLNISAPPHPHVAWRVVVNDQTGEWRLEPQGDSTVSAVMFALLLIIPPLTAILACLIFRWKFYGIRTNEWGLKPEKTSYFPIGAAALGALKRGNFSEKKGAAPGEVVPTKSGAIIGWPEDPAKPRRKVLIASLEYEILDWKLKGSSLSSLALA
jgi:alpha-1,3-glucan synthase